MNFNDSWNQDKYQEFIKYLESLGDSKYREFHSQIIECEEVFGIKTGKLKEIAKEISKGDYKSYIECNKSTYYEPIMIEGFCYGFLKKIPFDELTALIDKYLLKVNNWAHIDLLVTNLKQFKKSPKEGFKYAKSLTHSKNNWAKRCGIVILLTYYLHDVYIDKTLEVVTKIKSKDYYVKMAIAWLVSISYIKYKEKTLVYLVNIKDDFTYNKTLSKIIDSRRISNEEKDFIRSLKRDPRAKEKIG